MFILEPEFIRPSFVSSACLLVWTLVVCGMSWYRVRVFGSICCIACMFSATGLAKSL